VKSSEKKKKREKTREISAPRVNLSVDTKGEGMKIEKTSRHTP